MEDLNYLENMFQEFGRLDGLEKGIQLGYMEGKLLGLQKGFDIAKEIGFYTGVCKCWINHLTSDTEAKYPKRLLKQCQQLVDLCELYHCQNQLNDDPVQLLNNIRAKYIGILSSTKSNQSYQRTDHSLNQLNLSF
ncbi:hypothetical protein BC833DRAFT_578685 [Globomyces pollinis-pini]|nr:hypothetical protein BC833DRAFT_578685 [Globomyces pollinis-pini]